MSEQTKTSLLDLSFSVGFGQAVFFPGSEKHPPRFRNSDVFLCEGGEALSVAIPPDGYYHDCIAIVYLGGKRICTVTDDPKYGRRYIFIESVTEQLTGDNSLLLAQVSAMVHEAIAAKTTHKLSDFAGIIPTGV